MGRILEFPWKLFHRNTQGPQFVLCPPISSFFLEENPEDQHCVKIKNVLKEKTIAGYSALAQESSLCNRINQSWI